MWVSANVVVDAGRDVMLLPEDVGAVVVVASTGVAVLEEVLVSTVAVDAGRLVRKRVSQKGRKHIVNKATALMTTTTQSLSGSVCLSYTHQGRCRSR